MYFFKITVIFICLLLPIGTLAQQTKPKIGIYDSRAIAIVYARSSSFNKQMKLLLEEMKIAKQKGDSSKIRQLDKKGSLQQCIMHDQGFGRGSVISILSSVQDSANEIAKKNNLSAIVSKWELLSISKEIETVDITMQLIELFHPDENTRTMVKDLIKTEPIENAFFIED
jgi:Skp family chaperone for outer membrane proteins